MAQNASAQPPEASQVGEVVVTALRRDTTVTKAPAAITAISGAALRQQQITGLSDLSQKVPGLQYGETVGVAQLALRGVSLSTVVSGLESPIALHSDGVYLPSAIPLDVLFMDVGDVEVLRGPQGTLYGRNATGGSINFIPQRPTSVFSGYANLSYGAYDSHREEGAISGPIVDGLSGRLYLLNDERDSGFMTNIVNGDRIGRYAENGVRPSLRFQPIGNLTIDASYFYFRRTGDPAAPFIPITPIPASTYAANPGYVGAPVSLDPRRPAYDHPGDYSDTDQGGLLSIAWSPSDAFSIEAHTSYTQLEQRLNGLDGDGTGIPILSGPTSSQSQTFQEDVDLKGTAFGKRLAWVVGGYYGDSTDIETTAYRFANPQGFVQLGPTTLPNGFTTSAYGKVKTTSVAAFADLTVHATDQLDFYGGVRAGRDQRQGDFYDTIGFGGPSIPTCSPAKLRSSVAFDDVTGKAGAEYHLSPNSQIYVQWQQGFKSGGFNPTSCGAAFKPEHVDSYEAGYKAALGHHISVQIAVFHYNYANMQVVQYSGTSSTITNAASSTITGADVEAQWRPIPRLSFDATASVLPEARYNAFSDIDPLDPAAGLQNLSGKRLVQAPLYTLDLGAQYAFPLGSAGDLTVRVEAYNNSGEYFRPYNLPPDKQGAYNTENLFLTYQPANSKWQFRAWVRNIADDIHLVGGASSDLIGTTDGAFSMPRTFGAGVEYRW
jgi:iron complex outermembrane receptor protein